MHVSCTQSTAAAVAGVMLLLSTAARAERVLGVDNDDFDFDGLPGAQHEFKIALQAQHSDCYFQNVAQGAQLHVNYEVLRGGDMQVDFTVTYMQEPQSPVETHRQEKSGFYTLQAAKPGTYAICLDNSSSRYDSKLVYLYIVTFVMQEWTNFQMELSKIHIAAKNFQPSLDSVKTSLDEMRKSQTAARFNVVRDWYLVEGNNSYVVYWSVGQCLLIVLAAGAQVLSLRRLFNSPSTTATSKPRA